MPQLRGAFRSFMLDDTGATMVEYGLLVALIAVVVATAALTLGTHVSQVFTSAKNCVGTPTSCP